MLLVIDSPKSLLFKIYSLIWCFDVTSSFIFIKPSSELSCPAWKHLHMSLLVYSIFCFNLASDCIFSLRNKCSPKSSQRPPPYSPSLSYCLDISDNTCMGTEDKELTPTWQLGAWSGTSHPSLGAGVWFVSDIVLADGISGRTLSGQLWLQFFSSLRDAGECSVTGL